MIEPIEAAETCVVFMHCSCAQRAIANFSMAGTEWIGIAGSRSVVVDLSMSDDQQRAFEIHDSSNLASKLRFAINAMDISERRASLLQQKVDDLKWQLRMTRTLIAGMAIVIALLTGTIVLSLLHEHVPLVASFIL